jgi:EPS-associated MarR family transcriptional regulator
LNALRLKQAFLTNPTAPENAELEVMRLLGTQPEMTQRKVASSLGMSLGKANYCLRALIAKGFVKAENYRNSSNKLAYFYLLTPSGIAAKADLTREFLKIKMREYEQLGVEIELLKKENEDIEKGR